MEKWDDLTATLSYAGDSEFETMRVLLARGAPYITTIYDRLSPVLQSAQHLRQILVVLLSKLSAKPSNHHLVGWERSFL